VEQELGALHVHLDGHDDDAADEGHVLGHAVVEGHRLERQREARRQQRVALLERVGLGHVGQRLLDGLDGLDAVCHGRRHQTRVVLHQIRCRQAQDGVHEVFVLRRL